MFVLAASPLSLVCLIVRSLWTSKAEFLSFVMNSTSQCQILGIKKTLVYQASQYYNRYGACFNIKSRRQAGKRKLNVIDLKWVHNELNSNKSIYLDKMQHCLHEARGVQISLPPVLRTFKHMSLTHKHITVHALECKQLVQAAFMYSITKLVPRLDMFMFTDEAAQNKKTSTQKWVLKGSRCILRYCFVHGQRFSILPVLTIDGIIAYDIIPGSVTADKFVKFIREHVVSVSSSLLHWY